MKLGRKTPDTGKSLGLNQIKNEEANIQGEARI